MVWDKKMKKEDFLELTHVQLSEITGRQRQRFSEYNAGKAIGEKTITDYARKFGVSPGTLMDWIIEWRTFDIYDPNATYGRKLKIASDREFDDDRRFGRDISGLMPKEIFLGLDLSDLCEMLQMQHNRMRGFIGGTSMDEKTIRRSAEVFKITPGTFLDWFIQWKELQRKEARKAS